MNASLELWSTVGYREHPQSGEIVGGGGSHSFLPYTQQGLAEPVPIGDKYGNANGDRKGQSRKNKKRMKFQKTVI